VKRAALIALAACGPDEVDLTGVYAVSADLASMPCGIDDAVMSPPVAIKFFKSAAATTDYFTYSECSDLAATMCMGGINLDGAFAEPIAGGWRGIITISSPTGSSCTLTYREQTATLHGSLLIVEKNTYSAQVDNTAVLCTPDEADQRNTTMPCVAHERIEATKP
jgi:hypothetical protein